MGRRRLNFNQLRYLLRQITWKFIPKKYRKPFYLFGGILGLYTWLNFLVFLTQSRYLITVKNALNTFTTYVWITYDHKLVVTVIVALLLLISFKYFKKPNFDLKEDQQDKPTLFSGSIYYQVNSLITMLYLLFLILAFLPLIV